MDVRKLTAIFVAAVLTAACFPNPDDPVDYLELPESVIVQMDVAGAPGNRSAASPEFTLYGDGTLLIVQRREDGDEVVEAHLDKGEIEDLLEFIDDTGFFNFIYEQPTVILSNLGTTYIYVATRDEANAVAARALGVEVPDTPDFDQVRDLVEIRERLNEIADAVETESWEPKAGELRIKRLPEGAVAEEVWPFPAIDLDSIASHEPVAYRLDADGLELYDSPNRARESHLCPMQHAGAAFCVTYRPLLPHEENFPEFENFAP